jgi:hypothetical protein
MIHVEKLNKPGGILHVRFNGDGDSVWVFIKRKRAKVFPTMEKLIANVYFDIDTEHFSCSEEQLTVLYQSKEYSYKELKFKKENPDDPNQLKLWQ